MSKTKSNLGSELIKRPDHVLILKARGFGIGASCAILAAVKPQKSKSRGHMEGNYDDEI